jgi:fatty acid desaturase
MTEELRFGGRQVFMLSVSTANNKTERAPELAIPQRLNLGLLALHSAAIVFQLFILPIYLMPQNGWWSLTIIPLAALNNPLWALMHECIHDAFNASSRVNLAAGRWLSILFGSPFQILRLTHLSHHKFNRSPLEKGTEMYDPKQSFRFVAACQYYFYIICGVYLLEVFSAVMFLLPKICFHEFGVRLMEKGDRQERWLAQKFQDHSRQTEIRIDALGILLFYGFGAYCYGGHLLVFLSMVAFRAVLISLMDNVYHYGTTLKMTISGHNLALPRVLARGLLNFNFHRIHHTHPNVPWTGLPYLFSEKRDYCDYNFFFAVARQFIGPMSLEQLQPVALVTTGHQFESDPLPASSVRDPIHATQ